MKKNLEEMHWFDENYLKLSEVAKKHGFSVSVTGGGSDGKGDFADFIININDDNMLGLKLNPALAVKPFQIFPYGKDAGLDDIDEVLGEWSLTHESH
jgi:hypothetical protein